VCWCSVTNVTQWSSTQTSVYILTQLSVTHSTRTLSSRITGNCLSLPQPTPTFLTVCTHNMCFSGFVDVFMCGFTVNDVVVVVWKSPWDKSRISWTAMFQMKVHQSAASLVLWLVQKFRPCDDRILCLTNNWDILTCKLTDTVMCLVYLYTFAWSDGVYWWLKELLDFKNPAFSICKGFFRMTSDLSVSHDVNCRHHGVISCLTKCWQTDMCMCVCVQMCVFLQTACCGQWYLMAQTAQCCHSLTSLMTSITWRRTALLPVLYTSLIPAQRHCRHPRVSAIFIP